MWRKRQTRAKLAPNVQHNEQNSSDLVNILTNLSIKSEQKHDNLSNPLDILHEENVRLGLYEGVYDLSIKSDDLSIKSEEAMREVQRLGQEIQPELYKSTRQELREQIDGLERDYDLLLTKYKLLLAEKLALEKKHDMG
jgi:hypothetical protein